MLRGWSCGCGDECPHGDPQEAAADPKNRQLEADEAPLLPPSSSLMDLLSRGNVTLPGQNPKVLSLSQQEQVLLLFQVLAAFPSADKWANSSTLCLFWKTQIQPSSSTLTQFAT